MPKEHEKQKFSYENLDTISRSRKHVCMYCFYHENFGSSVLIILVGYGLSKRGVGDHTRKGRFEYSVIFSGFIIWSIRRYNILNLTRRFSLGCMHRLVFKILYGDSKDGHYDCLLTKY